MKEAVGEELRHTALTKRALNARQITMVEHDLFKGQAFEDQVTVENEILFSSTFYLKLTFALRQVKFANDAFIRLKHM